MKQTMLMIILSLNALIAFTQTAEKKDLKKDTLVEKTGKTTGTNSGTTDSLTQMQDQVNKYVSKLIDTTTLKGFQQFAYVHLSAKAYAEQFQTVYNWFVNEKVNEFLDELNRKKTDAVKKIKQ